ncbi:hypothetical protein LI328DRAFT_131860 [Trichoderma asperelloides]|nr:hypothetical protein LI328DRAFT_131860 [Trichoderma asperelloides]
MYHALAGLCSFSAFKRLSCYIMSPNTAHRIVIGVSWRNRWTLVVSIRQYAHRHKLYDEKQHTSFPNTDTVLQKLIINPNDQACSTLRCSDLSHDSVENTQESLFHLFHRCKVQV